jgi:maltose alpha-D-glucosyltransferase/alpha-amylase
VRRRKPEARALAANPLWYREAVIYELHVRAFRDSDADGIGDFKGLIEKLAYLEDLGATALWLLPFYPSPNRDGGYDIADYTAIHPPYGTLQDFKRLLDQAHRCGIRIITELVLNHTSSEHAWFQRARRSPPGSRWRNYYVWSDSAERYANARIIFKDFETSNWTWDPLAKAYYWHRFYSHQPDLNFDNPEVHRALLRAVDFWFGLGVDGMRLDAVPYLYEREGTNCENLPDTHAFLKKLRAHIDAHFTDRMLLAEANQWPEDAAAYFGDGDECHMNFHFPLMPRMFMAVQQEDRFPIVDILRQTPPIPAACQWATFLRNHDELTLEMVTDEERDYMHRVYAEDPNARINLGIRHRLAPLLRVRRKVELLNGLLFSLPGTPVLYYGDEIGMGDNIYLGDRDGVRTPMQWSADRNAGFSSANPQRLYLPVIIDPEYHYEATNVQAQQSNPQSLLWWMKRLINVRKQHRVFGAGELRFLSPENTKVLAFVRELPAKPPYAEGERVPRGAAEPPYAEGERVPRAAAEQPAAEGGRVPRAAAERVLVVANLSRFAQYVQLDLSAYRDLVPVEMFGRERFPTIGGEPYLLSLGPYGFYWFLLESPQAAPEVRAAELPLLEVVGSWRAVLGDGGRERLEPLLGAHIARRRWFRSKGRVPKEAHLRDAIRLPQTDGAGPHVLALVEMEYHDGDPETYVLPLCHLDGEEARAVGERAPHAVIARLRAATTGRMAGRPADEGLLCDGLALGPSAGELVEAVRRHAPHSGLRGQLHPLTLPGWKQLVGRGPLPGARVPQQEQTNSALVLGDRLLVKVYRVLEEGPNPELELGAFLAQHAGVVRCAPRCLGALEYRRHGRPAATVLTVQEFVPNEGTAWDFTLSSLDRYFERVLTSPHEEPPPMPAGSLLERAGCEPPPHMQELLGAYVAKVGLLGQKTAELHQILARGQDAAFAPEAMSKMHQRSLYQGAHGMLGRTCELLRRRCGSLPEPTRALVGELTAREDEIDRHLRTITSHPIEAQRVRLHGDFHLGQVLYLGDDFLIIDFEGEPARPLSERRYKRSVLRDVTGMLRSFSYAAEAALRSGRLRQGDVTTLRPWASAWRAWVGAGYLSAYLSALGPLTPLLPARREDRELLLAFHLLEKCTYEIGYELNNRPDWLPIPLSGLRELLDDLQAQT